MRNSVLLYINGVKHDVPSEYALKPLTDYLRYARRLTGTKVVCAEGDCGACTVLQIDYIANDNPEWKTLNACITTPAILDGSHLVTVEGLQDGETLHPVQEAMMEHHGAQCGFCTPGIVCSLVDVWEKKEKLSEKNIKNALTGNLCRCTGYKPILEAGLNAENPNWKTLSERYLNDSQKSDLKGSLTAELAIETENIVFYSPVSLQKLLEFQAENPDAKIVSAATDLGVQVNKGRAQYQKVCTPNRVAELFEIKEEPDKIIVGAKVNLHQLQNFVKNLYPEFHKMLDIFASPQIKNVATLVGNVVNASPIADTIPFLYAVEAQVEIQNRDTKRMVAMTDFYKGYKDLDLNPGEIVTAIHIPKLKEGQGLRLYKVSRRKDLDISCVTAAYFWEMKDDFFQTARIIYGGVGPTVLHCHEAEDFLIGKTFSLDVLKEAGKLAQKSVAPLSDVRGSKSYRDALMRGLMQKWFYEEAGQ